MKKTRKIMIRKSMCVLSLSFIMGLVSSSSYALDFSQPGSTDGVVVCGTCYPCGPPGGPPQTCWGTVQGYSVPEPSSILLFGIGLAGLAWYKKKGK